MSSLALVPTLLLLLAPASEAPPRSDEGAAIRERGNLRELIYDELDEVEGVVLSPDHDNVSARTRTYFGSLIRIRGDFRSQLIELSSDI